MPSYQQIAQHYRDKIGGGELRAGDRLPSVRDIIGEWGISHATAAKVVATLQSEGLVTTATGAAGGTFVSDTALNPTPRDHMLATRAAGRIYPVGNFAKIVAAELTVAGAEVAAALGVEEGARVIRRHRLTCDAGGATIAVSTSWFDGGLAGVAPDLLVADRIRRGTPGYVQDCTGRIMTAGRDQLTAGPATAEQARELGLAEGDPVLLGRNWVVDQDGEVIEYGEYVSAAGRWHTYNYAVDSAS